MLSSGLDAITGQKTALFSRSFRRTELAIMATQCLTFRISNLPLPEVSLLVSASHERRRCLTCSYMTSYAHKEDNGAITGKIVRLKHNRADIVCTSCIIVSRGAEGLTPQKIRISFGLDTAPAVRATLIIVPRVRRTTIYGLRAKTTATAMLCPRPRMFLVLQQRLNMKQKKQKQNERARRLRVPDPPST